MNLVDDIISKLETRQVAVHGLRCTWCPCCLHVYLKDPKVKDSFEMISLGEDGCKQQIKNGSIAECLIDMREEKQLRHSQ
jgi:hypothetical protein